MNIIYYCDAIEISNAFGIFSKQKKTQKKNSSQV